MVAAVGGMLASEARAIARIKQVIRDVPNFPKPGILFKDITPILADPVAFRGAIEVLAKRIARYQPHGIVAIESRGFLFGAALAEKMHLPLQLVRKPGKLPYKSVGYDYQLEYGSDRLEMHIDAVEPGRTYAVIDDLLATGGTANATAHLIEQQGGEVACCAFIIELAFLAGADRLARWPVEHLVSY